MSSILKALKKVEGGHPKYIHVRSWPRGIDAKKAISNRARGVWFVNQLVTVILAGLVFLGVGLYIIEKKPVLVSKILSDPDLKRETPKPEIARNKSVSDFSDRHVAKATPQIETNTVSALVEEEPAPLNGPGPVISEVAEDSEEITETPVQKESVPDLPPRSEEKPASPSPEKPAEKVKPAKPKRKILASVDTPAPPKERSLPIASPAKPKKTKTEKKTVEKKKAEPPIELPRKKVAAGKPGDDIGLTLQALVWSDDPESCFAVIDDIIVRQNGKVKGYTVRRIGKKHVVVGKKDKKWTLKFK